MPDISITVDAANVRSLLQRAPNDINQGMRGGMEDATTFLLARIRRYPPPRPNQKYVRTGTLNRSWSRRITGGGLSIQGIVGSNGNIAPYNRTVQDRTVQGAYFRGRWQTIQSVTEEETTRVQRMFADRLRAAGLP